MRRFTVALALLLVAAEVAYAFRTPSVRTRSRAPDEPPATVRMPQDAEPDPRRPHITIHGQPPPAAETQAPPFAEPKPAPLAEPPRKPEPIAEPQAPKPQPVAEPRPEQRAAEPSAAIAKPVPAAPVQADRAAAAPATAPALELPSAFGAPIPAPRAEPVTAPKSEPIAAQPKPEPIAAPKPEPIAEPPKPEPMAAAKPEPAVVQRPVSPRTPEPAAAAPPPPAIAPGALSPAPAAAPAPEERRREPVVVLPKAAAFSPAARPEPNVVAAAAPPALAGRPPVAAGKPDPRLIEAIFACLAPGLPNDWKRAWIVLSEPGGGRPLDARFFYTDKSADERGEPLVPCNAREVAERVLGLNELLPPDRRRWSQARLVITSDGGYELTYDYPQ